MFGTLMDYIDEFSEGGLWYNDPNDREFCINGIYQNDKTSHF